MSSKSLFWICMVIGSAIGGFLPSLWGTSAFSISGMVWSSVGAIVGIYFGYRLSQ